MAVPTFIFFSVPVDMPAVNFYCSTDMTGVHFIYEHIWCQSYLFRGHNYCQNLICLVEIHAVNFTCPLDMSTVGFTRPVKMSIISCSVDMVIATFTCVEDTSGKKSYLSSDRLSVSPVHWTYLFSISLVSGHVCCQFHLSRKHVYSQYYQIIRYVRFHFHSSSGYV